MVKQTHIAFLQTHQKSRFFKALLAFYEKYRYLSDGQVACIELAIRAERADLETERLVYEWDKEEEEWRLYQ